MNIVKRVGVPTGDILVVNGDKGKLDRIAAVGDMRVHDGEWNLPPTVGGSLDLRGCDLKGIKIPERFDRKIIK